MQLPGRARRAALALAMIVLAAPAVPVSAAGSGTLADPYVIGTPPATIEVDLGGYIDAPPPKCGQDDLTLWLATITVPTPTFVMIDTGGSDFDTVLALTSRLDDPGSQEICNDDSARSGGLTSQVGLTLLADTTYYVIVGRAPGSEYDGSGRLVLHVTDRQQIEASISTPTVGSLIGGSVACYPGDVSLALTGSATIDGKPVPLNVGGCSSDGTSRWTTGVAAKKGKSYRVEVTLSITEASGLFSRNGSASFDTATTTLFAKLKAQ
jgi:hypothetical protein